jgi:HemY protein
MALEAASPDQARSLALSAHKLAPSLVPAAVIFARISSRLGDLRKASKVLEATWKLEPHPEIAEAYVHVRSGDSAVDRLKRARLLAAKRENHVEGRFAIAGAAIDARDWGAAREALASILRSKPTERACLLMADIEEAEHGDRGRMRDWLSRAVRAPRDPAWTADGYTSELWAPVSPISGKLDAFEWKVPVELLDGPGETVDFSEFATAPLPPEPAPVVPVIAAVASSIDAGDITETMDGEIVDPNRGETADNIVEKETLADKSTEDDTPKAEDVKKTTDDSKDTDKQASKEPAVKPEENEPVLNGAASDSKEPALPKPPDDPGVGEDKPQPRRFKLF